MLPSEASSNIKGEHWQEYKFAAMARQRRMCTRFHGDLWTVHVRTPARRVQSKTEDHIVSFSAWKNAVDTPSVQELWGGKERKPRARYVTSKRTFLGLSKIVPISAPLYRFFPVAFDPLKAPTVLITRIVARLLPPAPKIFRRIIAD